MLDNVMAVGEVRSVARRKRRPLLFKSVRHALVNEEETNGWTAARRNRTTTRMSKLKPHHVLLEDRVWTLLYRLGFTHLSGDGGARVSTDGPEGTTTQIDVVALDQEVALAVECKSSETPQRRQRFAEEIAKHAALRETFARAVRTQFQAERKRQNVFAMFTANAQLSDNDRRRAEEARVILFDEVDLAYYEALASQLGPAARYQFLADMLPGREIEGLELRIPAVRNRIGGYSCYMFCVSPEYLLKIAYVSHRAKGKASDVDKYQRMMKRSRLSAIREYISRDGIFPTNIVVNVAARWLRFERVSQESSDSGSTVGWLHLRPAYKAAWVIDGQHRLYAYSGHPRAAKSVVPVMAFSGLPASEQARLFVDINAEQRKVKQNLLQELYAELHWDAADPEVRSRAILSKAIQVLDADNSSPLYGRILKADEPRTAKKCISLTSVFQAMEKTGTYVRRTKQGQVVEYGALWAGENTATLNRTVAVLKSWFGFIREGASDVWELGSAEGGGLAMNDGVTVCINVLRSVIDHCERRGRRLVGLDDRELVELIRPFSTWLGEFFGRMDAEGMARFRSLRGNQGQTTGTRRCEEWLHSKDASFDPPGLAEFLEAERTHTTKQAIEVILNIEGMMQKTVLQELKAEFGETAESVWWFEGVPKGVRKKVDDRINEDQGKRGGREENFDLIDYREIIVNNWNLFEEIFGYGKGSKEKRTAWIAEVNEMRKTAVHASRGARLPVTAEQLAALREKELWLKAQISGEKQQD